MKKNTHLFSCHKYLEEIGGQILFRIAKIDFRNKVTVYDICHQIEDYQSILINHTKWESEFILSKFFTAKEIKKIIEDHDGLDNQIKNIIVSIRKLLAVKETDAFYFYYGKKIYLDFRAYYAAVLNHFHQEETELLNQLQEKISDEEIRNIDRVIYQNMNSDEMIAMISLLFPPCNFEEKKCLLADLKEFNPKAFEANIVFIKEILTEKEAIEIF